VVFPVPPSPTNSTLNCLSWLDACKSPESVEAGAEGKLHPPPPPAGGGGAGQLVDPASTLRSAWNTLGHENPWAAGIGAEVEARLEPKSEPPDRGVAAALRSSGAPADFAVLCCEKQHITQTER
jgi:hypothetical protein